MERGRPLVSVNHPAEMQIRAITLHQPWASLCVLPGKFSRKPEKQFETRGFRTRYRGWILMHAGKNRDMVEALDALPHAREALERHGLNAWNIPIGALVGIVRIIDCLSSEALSPTLPPEQFALGDFSPNRYGWALGDPIRFANPIPASGKQGLWIPSDLLLAQVEDQISLDSLLANA